MMMRRWRALLLTAGRGRGRAPCLQPHTTQLHRCPFSSFGGNFGGTPLEPVPLSSLLDFTKLDPLRKGNESEPAVSQPHMAYTFEGHFQGGDIETVQVSREGMYINLSSSAVKHMPEGLLGDVQEEIQLSGVSKLMVRQATKELFKIIDRFTLNPLELKPRQFPDIHIAGYTDKPEWTSAENKVRYFGTVIQGLADPRATSPPHERAAATLSSIDPFPQKLMLTGPRGSGKSCVLTQAVIYARQRGWIVLSVPRAYDHTYKGGWVEPCRHHLGTFQSPMVTQPILRDFLSAHGKQIQHIPLTSAKLRERYMPSIVRLRMEIAKRVTTHSEEKETDEQTDKWANLKYQGAKFDLDKFDILTLADLCTHGLVIPSECGDVFMDVVEELKHLAQIKSSEDTGASSRLRAHPVMFAVDQYDAWFASTQHWYENKRLAAHQLAVPRALSFIQTKKRVLSDEIDVAPLPEWAESSNALFVCALSGKHAMQKRINFSQYSKSIPLEIKVPQYSAIEFLAAMKYYAAQKLIPQDFTVQDIKHLRMLCASNPALLRTEGWAFFIERESMKTVEALENQTALSRTGAGYASRFAEDDYYGDEEGVEHDV